MVGDLAPSCAETLGYQEKPESSEQKQILGKSHPGEAGHSTEYRVLTIEQKSSADQHSLAGNPSRRFRTELLRSNPHPAPSLKARTLTSDSLRGKWKHGGESMVGFLGCTA
jgi:hypothetical protein